MTTSAILSTPITTDAPPFRAAGSAPSRAALHPLQNHNYPANAIKVPPSKPQRPIIYSHYQAPPVYAVVVDSPQADKDCKALSGSNDSDSTQAKNARALFLKQFDYVEMRCFVSRVELPKRPCASETGVVFHSPAISSVSYDTFFQTTHDFLDLSQALRMFPFFVDLPMELRPSKARYDATKNSDDLMLRVRCLFCRGRFGGKNAKAIWERHVKEHWPKLDRGKDSVKEEVKRPIRHVHKRATGSNAHSRTRSQDSTWLPTRLKSSVFHERVPSFGSASSCSSPASSVMSLGGEDDVAIASPTYFPHVHEIVISDKFEESIQVEIKSPVRSPRKRIVRKIIRQSSPGLEDDSDYDDCGMLRIGRWRIQAEIEEYQRLARPLLSQDEIITALQAATERATDGSPANGDELTLASLNSPDDSQLSSPFTPPTTRKRSRAESEGDCYDLHSEPSKRKRSEDTDSDSFSSISGYDSSTFGSSLDLSLDSIESPITPESSFDMEE